MFSNAPSQSTDEVYQYQGYQMLSATVSMPFVNQKTVDFRALVPSKNVPPLSNPTLLHIILCSQQSAWLVSRHDYYASCFLARSPFNPVAIRGAARPTRQTCQKCL